MESRDLTLLVWFKELLNSHREEEELVFLFTSGELQVLGEFKPYMKAPDSFL